MRSDFLESFYARFLGSSPEVAEKFKHTDFQHQRRMLKSSLYLLVFAAEGKEEGLTHLERMGELHGRSGRDIRPELYDLWLECLMQCVREYDPQFNPEIELAWNNVLQEGIAFLKSRY